MAHHDLKTWPKEFRAAAEGRKPFEYRRDDRTPPFAPGDTATLLEFSPQGGGYTGKRLDVTIGMVLRDAPHYHLPEGFAVFAIQLASGGPALAAMLEELRSQECDSVTLFSDNPDGPPNNAVECFGLWTDLRERRFEGETIIAAAHAAVMARRAALQITS